MPLNDIAEVNVGTTSVRVARAGFGVALILGGYSKTWPERYREYGSLSALAVDFAAGTPEYLAAAALFAQQPPPTRVAVGRCALPPTQRWTLTPVTTIQAIHTYRVVIGGVAYDFVSDATPTAAEVVAGLTTVINAATGTHGLVASGTSTLVLTANAAGAWQRVAVGDVNLLRLVQDHADPGIATDLAAIALENSTWYGVINPWNSTAEVLAIAAWVETAQKLFVAQTQETQVIDTADGSATDVAHALKAAAYARTAVIYSPDTGDFADAAWAGKCLPLDPGSETWKFKTLAGVTASNLTATQVVNLKAKNCGYYYDVGGVSITAEGVVAAGEYIDVVRFRDWLAARLQERTFGVLANARKVPYTDAGIAVVEAEVRAQLREAIDVGGLAESPAPVVTVPKASAVSSTDRSARVLRNVAFTAVLAGAIHHLTINGTVTV